MADSVQLLRQWTVLRTLSARRQGATLKELAAETGVSEKTIGRDLSLLRRLAFPIDEKIGEHGRKHWMMTDTEGLPALGFTLAEAAALYLGRQFLEGLAGTLFWTGAQSAFKKIQSALGDAALQHLHKLAAAFYLKTHALTDYSSRADLIDQLMVAILNEGAGHECRFDTMGPAFSDRKSSRSAQLLQTEAMLKWGPIELGGSRLSPRARWNDII